MKFKEPEINVKVEFSIKREFKERITADGQ